MKRDFLKPYIHKVKGAVNYGLYDILHGKFYQVAPEGDLQELRESFLKEGLIFETEGCVPVKLKIDITETIKKLSIRRLQIKLNGKKEDNCRQRNTITDTLDTMTLSVLQSLVEKLTFLPVQDIRIEADIPDAEKIEMILQHLNCVSVTLFLKNRPPIGMAHHFSAICHSRNIDFAMPTEINAPLEDINVQLYRFFYSQEFNTCYGHQVAVDTQGEIKPCLWSNTIVGNILTDNLREMIIAGKFDDLWEITKDKIEVCKDCEWRYACADCRVAAGKVSGDFFKKPNFCTYDPYEQRP